MGSDRAEEIWERPLTRRQLMSAMVVGGAGMALVGCGDDDDDVDVDDGGGEETPVATASPAAGTPKQGGEITILLGNDMEIGDPQKTPSLTGGNSDMWGLVASQLLHMEWGKSISTPAVAEKWEIPDDTTTILSLKKGVHFQKLSAAAGRELDSSDVVASLERARTDDPTFAGRYQFQFVDTYEAVDKYTVRIKFKNPDANFMLWIGVTPGGIVLSKESIALYGANFGGDPKSIPQSGAFIADYASYKPKISLSVNRNPDYDLFPGLPYLDKINMILISDRGLKGAAMRSGEADIGNIPTLEVKDYQSKPYTLGSTEDLITAGAHLAMNTEAPPTNDVRVRGALHRAIDREALLQVVGDGGFGCIAIIFGCQSAWYLTAKDFEGTPGFRKDKSEDYTEAKQLLSAAGVDPTQVTLDIYSGSNTSPYPTTYRQAEAVAGMIQKNLGFKLNILPDRTMTPKTLRERKINLYNNTGGGLSGGNLDYPAWRFHHSDGANNYSLWYDDTLDGMIVKQAQTLDNADRKKQFAAIQRYMLDPENGLPVSPTARNYDFFAAKDFIKGWRAPSYFLSNFAWQFPAVWLDK